MRAVEHPPLHLGASAGQALSIVLDATAGAGLRWQAPPPPAGCTLQADGQQPGGAGDGAAVQQRFVFAAERAGKQVLRFELRRDWETAAHAVQLVQVDVR